MLTNEQRHAGRLSSLCVPQITNRQTTHKTRETMKHTRITKADLQRLERIADKLTALYYKYAENEIPTTYNNGTQEELINAARAALDCIFQEYTNEYQPIK